MVFVQENMSKKTQEKDNSQVKAPFSHFLAPPLERNEDGSLIENKDPSLFRDLTDAIRCVKVSPDGKNLACGDWVGNIRIYDLAKPTDIEQVNLIEAHDSEVICLAYSPEIKESGRFWLASGSRDKSTLVFDSKNDYSAVCAMKNHNSTVTAL